MTKIMNFMGKGKSTCLFTDKVYLKDIVTVFVLNPSTLWENVQNGFQYSLLVPV